MLHGWIVGFCDRTLSELNLNGRLTGSKELLGAVVPQLMFDTESDMREQRSASSLPFNCEVTAT